MRLWTIFSLTLLTSWRGFNFFRTQPRTLTNLTNPIVFKVVLARKLRPASGHSSCSLDLSIWLVFLACHLARSIGLSIWLGQSACPMGLPTRSIQLARPLGPTTRPDHSVNLLNSERLTSEHRTHRKFTHLFLTIRAHHSPGAIRSSGRSPSFPFDTSADLMH